MPARAPFTSLCQLISPLKLARADLHVHTTASDGSYTPTEVVDLARRSGLAAIALTDHDTLEGIPLARQAALGGPLEVIPGVEISGTLHGREVHVLAYFVNEDDDDLGEALLQIRQDRVHRFREMVEGLRRKGLLLREEDEQGLERELSGPGGSTLGRRHLAAFLVQAGRAATIREAFRRYLHDGSGFVSPKKGLPLERACGLIRAAGGVSSLAHPPADWDLENFREARDLGLDAVEVEFPQAKGARKQRLRAWADQLQLAITGGSDCHGPGRQCIGGWSISDEELQRLRARAGRRP